MSQQAEQGIRLRAERRLGEMMSAHRQNGGGFWKTLTNHSGID
jgi:hypothetical protein